MSDSYKNDFEKFLDFTDEKKVLLDEIHKEINKYQVKSMLDIGAGNGLLSIPLSKKVTSYSAVESKTNFANKLKSAGLKTTEAEFPCQVEGSYDLVLASHVISYKKDKYEPFIRKAWELVNNGKVILIVTYRGQEDDWTKLMRSLNQPPEDNNRSGYNKIIELLFSLGEVKIKKAITTVKTKNLAEMIDALSFVASDGTPERKEKFMGQKNKIEKFLKSKYLTENGFEFPFQHYFITTIKNKS